ncbi:MAG: hypothetical protein ASARMPREDX12_008348 [Alectoria sarmentosa]|nr:MAG: hypothetical protein ASARMPREDX12_008348 [Alectoria sarmentosa]
MFQRGGRRPVHDDPNESDIVSPGAASLSGGRRPEPRGQGRRPAPDPSNSGLRSHEAGPHSRRPNEAGRARQAEKFEDDYGDEEPKARLPRQSHEAGSHSRRPNPAGRARQAEELEDGYGDEEPKTRLPRQSHEAGPHSSRPNPAGRTRQAEELEDDYGVEGLKARFPRQSHEAGPHSRRPNPAGRARQADDFEDDYGAEGLKARPPRQSHAGGRRHHHAEEESSFAEAEIGARQKFAGVREGHHAEEGDEFETAGNPFSRQSFPGSGRNHADEEDVFKDAGEIRRRHDHAGVRRNGFPEEADGFEAAGARPHQQKPLGRARGPATRHEPAHNDDDRYGSSGRGGGNRARERDEDELDGEIHRASRALVRGGGKSGSSTRGAHGDSGSHRHSRYIPYTFRVLPLDYLELLKWVFHVPSSKVEEWCNDGFIRLDKYTTKGCPYNIDPLLAKVPEKDRKVYEEKIRKTDIEHELRAIMGKNIRTVEDAIKEKDLRKSKDHSKGKNFGKGKDLRMEKDPRR